MSGYDENQEALRLLHSGGVKHVVDVPRHLVPRVVQRLTSCIEHDHTHVFVVDQSGGMHVRFGVSDRGYACVAPLLRLDTSPKVPIKRYEGPDQNFGEHDDYKVGDEVWTYDNAPGLVVFIQAEAVSTSPYRAELTYNVEGPDHTGGNYRVRTYDASRLALVRRKA